MVPIHTHPPSKAYDEGWDAIFGKKDDAEASPDQDESPPEPPAAAPTPPPTPASPPDRVLPGGGIRKPRA